MKITSFNHLASESQHLFVRVMMMECGIKLIISKERRKPTTKKRVGRPIKTSINNIFVLAETE